MSPRHVYRKILILLETSIAAGVLRVTALLAPGGLAENASSGCRSSNIEVSPAARASSSTTTGAGATDALRLIRRRWRVLFSCVAAVLLYLAVSSVAYTHITPKLDLQLVRSRLFRTPPPPPLPRTLVGRRRFTPQQSLTRSCPTIDHYISAIAQARINEDGPSRKVNWSEPATDELPVPFRFSFELEGGCRQPVWYDTERACDLLQSFGGVYMRGDSYVRHIWEALFMIVTNSTDGAISNPRHYKECRGEHMFNDKKICRDTYFNSLPLTSDTPCGGLVAGQYDRQEFPAEANLSPFFDLLRRRSATYQQLSPIFLQANGVHYNFHVQAAATSFVLPVMALRDRSFPPPISIWAGLHAPGENILEEYREAQGRDRVQAFNRDIKVGGELRTKEIAIGDGGMRVLEFYNITEGAESFDGQHYSYQVNMEKVQLLLNILDLTWNDIVVRGGLLVLQPDASQFQPPISMDVPERAGRGKGMAMGGRNRAY